LEGKTSSDVLVEEWHPWGTPATPAPTSLPALLAQVLVKTSVASLEPERVWAAAATVPDVMAAAIAALSVQLLWGFAAAAAFEVAWLVLGACGALMLTAGALLLEAS